MEWRLQTSCPGSPPARAPDRIRTDVSDATVILPTNPSSGVEMECERQQATGTDKTLVDASDGSAKRGGSLTPTPQQPSSLFLTSSADIRNIMANVLLSITPMTQAQKVREELFRTTAQAQWNEDEYWKYFLRGRREIFDAIYKDIEGKDWLNPATAQRVEEDFVARAQGRWGGVDERWVLSGQWLNSRPDIVTWMRSTYWKHNKKRLEEDQQYASTQATGGPADTPFQTETRGETWKDVMLH
ncbi:hypothetical protein G7Y89_g930 [Cudoniella acicularis]|uniref:Uncharacterized protein n=1 Tax=Cudoniella acicularis TaxID=354080 RepID=A0A8H4RZ33_9HELO|nr:hypothetical protein G7Y89_g930 [Cudoniella acicularis]